jgi:hypothetical protein
MIFDAMFQEFAFMIDQIPIYQDRNVFITDHVATLLGVSYPLRAISSIRIKRTNAVRLLAALIACIAELSAISFYLRPGSHMEPLVMMGGGFALLIGAFLTPPDFKLILVTNACEGVVFTSKDRDYIERVRAAIEQAIIGAGQAVTGRDQTGMVMGVTPRFRKPVPGLSNQSSRVQKA